MPRFNRTGPEGQGSQTGRKLGKCNPNSRYNEEVAVDFSPGRRLGRGLGLNGRLKPGNGNKRGRGFWKFNT